jgi:hypothetical protein
MPDLSWRDAIITVLRQEGEPMLYTDIAEAVAEQGLRSELGATPAKTVNVAISTSINSDGEDSPFRRVSRGQYGLREFTDLKSPPISSPQPGPDISEEVRSPAGLVNAFGMYWSRTHVLWSSTPRILGQQQIGSTPVDFCQQHGVYLLHDGRAVIYVGRTTDQPLGVRLRQHISDRLNGRWDRFSWFGVYPVSESGQLDIVTSETYSQNVLIATMEALLIEGLEPPQNRKRGDDFRASEFLQVEDPDIQKTQIIKLMDELKTKL